MSSIPPTKLREVLFLFVYALDFSFQENKYALLEMIMDELKVSRSAVKTQLARAEQVLQEKEKLDQMISDVVLGYSIERLKSVERTILRVLIFEMEEHEKKPLPLKVAISEGKRLTRKFASPEAAPLVHAVIAAIVNKKTDGKNEAIDLESIDCP